MATRAPSPAKPARAATSAKGKSAAPAPAKGKPAAPKAAKPSPAIVEMPPERWPKSHPLVGKKVKYSTVKNPKVRLGTVRAGDGVVILIEDLWHFTTSVTFA